MDKEKNLKIERNQLAAGGRVQPTSIVPFRMFRMLFHVPSTFSALTRPPQDPSPEIYTHTQHTTVKVATRKEKPCPLYTA